MAKAPKNMRRPKNISKDDWDRLSMTGKKNALLKAGDDEGYRVMSKGAGRIQHASTDPKRAGEAKTVTKNMRGMASKLNDPMVRADLGGRNIIRTNKKINRAGMAKGVTKAGSDAAIKDLRKTIKEALAFTKGDLAKNAARIAKRLK